MLAPSPCTDPRNFPTHKESDRLVGGSGWKKAFTRHSIDGLTWMTIDRMKFRARSISRLSEGYFTVKIVRPGFIHIEETEDETEWTVEDIFKLPGGYRVGGGLDGQRIKLDEAV